MNVFNRMGLNFGDGQDDFWKKISEAKVVTPEWHVGSDNFLEQILQELWIKFIELRHEINCSAEKSNKEATINYKKWNDQLTYLNPTASSKEIEKESIRLSGIDKKPTERVAHKYFHRILPLYTEVTIIAAALCEAEINLALAWSFSITDKEELFELIESKSALDKWRHGLKIVLPNYSLRSDCAELQTLVKIFGERNRFAHPKSTIQISGKIKLKPKSSYPRKIEELLHWTERYFSLPFDLADFLRTQPAVHGERFPVMAQRGPIKRASQHQLPQPPKSDMGSGKHALT